MTALVIVLAIVAVLLGGLAFWQYRAAQAAALAAEQRQTGGGSGLMSILRIALAAGTGGAATPVLGALSARGRT